MSATQTSNGGHEEFGSHLSLPGSSQEARLGQDGQYLLLLVSLPFPGLVDCGLVVPSTYLPGLGWAFSSSGQGAMVCGQKTELKAAATKRRHLRGL